ncbi:class I SAM-dependent methyltransferase [Peribacillus muralis]|uniref:class I SAM-dependent methyltransferase n=1 Tax=Peribacillus muralis TaxID=264697 RepID=UPI0036721063
MAWEFHDTPFVMDLALELPSDYLKNGAWSGHRRFVYDLVRFVKPVTIVELGTHHGTSFFSFCQAVRDAQIPTYCYAIDTWRGDPHSGYYGDHVYQAVKAVSVREFPDIGKLLRMDFDQAITLFEDNSIDLLHIDGYHTYEAAHHDYTSWYPKLKENSIVLFHDTVVRNDDFGVYRLWEELSELPHFEFPHSNGLGILFPKGVPDIFQSIMNNKDTIIQYYVNKHTE